MTTSPEGGGPDRPRDFPVGFIQTVFVQGI